MHPLRILVAPSGFKECLYAADVAEAIASGLRRASPAARIVTCPVVDGGEGFARTLALRSGGMVEPVAVSGPLGGAVEAHLGWLGGAPVRTAVIEMASAAGLRLVPRDRRNPLRTTTRGVGELIRAALDRGAGRILLGCGDSGTSDAGAGMAAALGIRFLDAAGADLPPGGGALADLASIDRGGLDPRLAAVPIEVACNTRIGLTGPRGVARGFAPQKGATPGEVRRLELGLERFAAVAARDCGTPGLEDLPGGGASGGLGAGLHALLGARLRPWQEIVLAGIELDREVAAADLVVTAEGGIDAQTPHGKIPAVIARCAQAHGVPVLALAGCIGEGAGVVHDAGIGAVFSTLGAAVPLAEAIRRAPADIARAAEQALRGVLLGATLSARRCPGPATRAA
jgi:glycerate kinase